MANAVCSRILTILLNLVPLWCCLIFAFLFSQKTMHFHYWPSNSSRLGWRRFIQKTGQRRRFWDRSAHFWCCLLFDGKHSTGRGSSPEGNHYLPCSVCKKYHKIKLHEPFLNAFKILGLSHASTGSLSSVFVDSWGRQSVVLRLLESCSRLNPLQATIHQVDSPQLLPDVIRTSSSKTKKRKLWKC